MQKNSTRKLVLTAVFAALICIVTFTVKFPVPGITNAYVNAGDGFVYAAAIVLGGPLAAVAAGIGSMFADLFAGAAIYMPATLIIKAAMAFIVGFAYNKKANWVLWLGLMAVASLVMAAGYGIYETFIYGFPIALTNLPFNLIQAAGGVILGLLLSAAVVKVIPPSWKETLK
jgi:uncharacterized membrane protein